MLDRSIKRERSLDEIIDSLFIKEDAYYTIYQSRCREDHDRLLGAALSGNLDGLIAVGHAAIYRDRLRVSPPVEVGN